MKFSYIRRLGRFLFWFKILNFNILGDFPKNEHFLGYTDYVDIFLVSSQNLTTLRGHFYAFLGSFLKVKVQNGGYSFGLLKFQILFLGAWNS